MGCDPILTAVATAAALSERRLNRLTNPALSVGLPAFLTKGAGMMSGMMLSQYTAGMLVVVVIAYFAGVDITPLLQNAPQQSGGETRELSHEEERAAEFTDLVRRVLPQSR